MIMLDGLYVQRMSNILMWSSVSKRWFMWIIWKWQFLCATNTFVLKYDLGSIELKVHNDLRIGEMYTPRASTKKPIKLKLIHESIKGAKKCANSNFIVPHVWSVGDKMVFLSEFYLFVTVSNFTTLTFTFTIQSSIVGNQEIQANKWRDVSKFLVDTIHAETSWVHRVQMFLIDNIILLSNSNFQSKKKTTTSTSHWWILHRVFDVDLNRRWSSTINWWMFSALRMRV